MPRRYSLICVAAWAFASMTRPLCFSFTLATSNMSSAQTGSIPNMASPMRQSYTQIQTMEIASSAPTPSGYGSQ